MSVRSFKVKIPASSANIGPGFDVLGIGLNLYLEIYVKVDPSKDTTLDPNNAKLTYEGDGARNVSLNSGKNLITQTALYILRCNGIKLFSPGTHIHVVNPIPLGRGLGSSAAAIVGGMMLGNEIGKLKLSKIRLMDYCLLIERHPDNLAAAMFGGFIGSHLNELSADETAAKNLPLEYILPNSDTSKEKYITTPPPNNIGQYLKYGWSKAIKLVTIIPKFEVPTDKSREVLPKLYEKSDVVYNLQRLAILTTVLTQEVPNNKLIYEAMKDKIHQPYRAILIPGLVEILNSITPDSYPGFCGICLSGAGPTILCLATSDFEEIAKKVISIFNKEDIECTWKLLDLAEGGATVEYEAIDT